MEKITATVDDLLPPVPIEGLDPSSKFRILWYNVRKQIIEFDLMRESAVDEEYFRLNDEILDVVELCVEQGLTFQGIPKLKEIVLAPKNSAYHRAFVVKVYEGQSLPPLARVYFIDSGGHVTLPVDKLLPVTSDLMDFPMLSYHVYLHGVKPTPGVFCLEYFKNFMNNKNMLNMTFTAELTSEAIKKSGLLTVPNYVKLSYINKDFNKVLLSKTINEIMTWEWEKYVSSRNGQVTDDEICEKGVFGSDRRLTLEDMPVGDISVKVGDKFTAEMSRLEIKTDEGEQLVTKDGEPYVFAHLTLLDTEDYLNQFDVLHGHLNRFADVVKPSDFFPAMDEMVMFKVVTTEDTREVFENVVKQTDRWCRGVRFEKNIYLMDLDDYVPFLELNTGRDYQIRRLYGEFAKIQRLSVLVALKRKGKFIPPEVANQAFQRGKRYSFEITKCLPKESAYEAEVDFIT